MFTYAHLKTRYRSYKFSNEMSKRKEGYDCYIYVCATRYLCTVKINCFKEIYAVSTTLDSNYMCLLEAEALNASLYDDLILYCICNTLNKQYIYFYCLQWKENQKLGLLYIFIYILLYTCRQYCAFTR